MTTKQSLLLTAFLAPLCPGAVLFTEEFDGNTNGYNVSSTTALVGDDEWVDFNNRIGVSDISGLEGYQTASGGTETVLGGASTGNDPQIRSDFALGIAKADITDFVLRLRIDVDDNGVFDDTIATAQFDVRWSAVQFGNPGATNVATSTLDNDGTLSLVAESDGWYVATWSSLDLSSLAGTNLEGIRIDPTNGTGGSGDSFEIDYFTINGIPEPASASLLALSLAGLALRRRR